jgi:hypothetical protein
MQPCRLEIGDTAGLETCATTFHPRRYGGRVEMRPDEMMQRFCLARLDGAGFKMVSLT